MQLCDIWESETKMQMELLDDAKWGKQASMYLKNKSKLNFLADVVDISHEIKFVLAIIKKKQSFMYFIKIIQYGNLEILF